MIITEPGNGDGEQPTPPDVTDHDYPEPPVFDGLRFSKYLGGGGSAHVYLYEQNRPRIRFAVKVLRIEIADKEAAQRFATEAEIMAALGDHPNIVQVIKTGTLPDSRPYLVMGYYPPPTLSILAESRRLSVQEVLRIGVKIAGATQTAHQAGILHRDIKPANILMSSVGEPALTDFGMASYQRISASENNVGVSVPWVAREVLSGESNGSVQADIYSLCATLWHLLVGRSPFEISGGDNSVRSMFGRILRESPPPTNRADVPALLEKLLASGMAKLPKDRPNTARQLANELQIIERRLNFSQTEIVVPVIDEFPSGNHLSRSIEARPETPSIRSRNFSFIDDPTVTRRRPLDPQITAPPKNVIGEYDGGAILDNRFTLLEQISLGQSGVLYKAYDRHRGKLVAIKFLNVSDEDVQYRLERGGRVWLNLSHSNIVQTYEVNDSDGDTPGFIVSEYIEGSNLESYCASHDLKISEIINIIGQIADALAYLHGEDVVYREVNPRNIMVLKQRPLKAMLLDSGVVRTVNPDVEKYTKTGVFVGDLAYAAPDQLEGLNVTRRVDIWALTALLYDLACGSGRPVNGSWRPDVADLAHLPAGVRVAIIRGLSNDSERSYNSTRELQKEIGYSAEKGDIESSSDVVALHGIRTHGAWQRALSEVASAAGVVTRFDRWNFGYFSLLRFLSPWSRAAKVQWFREMYQAEFGDPTKIKVFPSIVAHSFGTYILGNALLRYPFLRFEKVLLCGSILPRDFPWDRLIEEGQVGELRNEYGIEDIWTKRVGLAVPGTGPSGLRGFDASGPHIEQEQFLYSHSEYFSRGHMDSRWMPFLSSPGRLTNAPAPKPVSYHARTRPWLLWGGYGVPAAAVLYLPHLFHVLY